MASYVQQYRPISNAETCYNAPLTVRVVRAMADNINNTKAHVQNFKVRMHIDPNVTGYGMTNDWPTHGPYPNVEKLNVVTAGIKIPDGYSNFCYRVGHILTNAICNCEWRIYSSDKLYTDSRNFVLNAFTVYDYVAFNSASNAFAITTGTDLQIKRNRQGITYLTITSNVANENARAKICTLDIWPVMPDG